MITLSTFAFVFHGSNRTFQNQIRVAAMTKNHQRLKIENILQFSVLLVNEKGSVGAVSQSASVDTMSLRQPPLRRDLLVDQLFVMMIVDTAYKLPLLMAKIDDP